MYTLSESSFVGRVEGYTLSESSFVGRVESFDKLRIRP